MDGITAVPYISSTHGRCGQAAAGVSQSPEATMVRFAVQFETACPEHDSGISWQLKLPSGISAAAVGSKCISCDAKRDNRNWGLLGGRLAASFRIAFTVTPDGFHSRACSSAGTDQGIPTVQLCLGQSYQAAKSCRSAKSVCVIPIRLKFRGHSTPVRCIRRENWISSE